MDIARFRKLPVMGIVRGVRLDEIEPLVDAIIASGLETIEITMNTEHADELIQRAVKAAEGRLMIGAGTVLNVPSAERALDSGATFIVMPTLVTDVMEYCVKNVLPVFPGALTPQEIHNAWSAGATMVKVFPAGVFGPGYFKELQGPFDHIELMACGGVTTENVRSYFAGGASAVAFGASIFRREWLAEKAFIKIEQATKKLTTEVASCL